MTVSAEDEEEVEMAVVVDAEAVLAVRLFTRDDCRCINYILQLYTHVMPKFLITFYLSLGGARGVDASALPYLKAFLHVRPSEY